MCLFSLVATAADWTGFRGPGGNATSQDTVPDKWSEKENVLWKTKLPGLGTSSPITVGDAIFLTCYSGYAETAEQPGDQKNLMRHVVCLDRKTGAVRWTKDIKPELPESTYKPGNDSWHGYASSTPTSDGEFLYVFFGKTGVFCFDLTGKQIWQKSVGTGTTGWGSASSPLLYKDLLIVNAAVESGTLYGFDKKTGNEVWKTPGMRSAWSSPILVDVPNGKAEVVLNLPGRPGKITAFDPTNGKELWHCEGIPDGYVCPSVISHDGIVYAIGGRKNTSVAVKAGGKGEVKPLWTTGAGSNVTSPIYHEGHVYWLHESRNVAYCVDAKSGKQVYGERVPAAGRTYASATVANGKVYYQTQDKGTLVVAAKPKFELIATNKLDDKSRTNASPVVDNGRLLIRTDQHLYCIGKK
jgi:outer membrane protein assembly factor BamB